MDANKVVEAMIKDALEMAHNSPHTADTPETRAAYARGVRAMAGLVNACMNVADGYADKYTDHPFAGVMFNGYATALRHIVKAADGLIPPGYEK